MNARYRKAAAITLTLILGLIAAIGFNASPATAAAPGTECTGAFGSGYVGYKIDDVNEGQLNGTYVDSSTGFSVTVSNTNVDQHTFNYVSNRAVNVIVKGGPDQGELYSPPASSRTGLHPPVNPNNGKYYGVSHITFCWQPTGPTGPGQPKLKVTKIADNPVVQDGDQVKFRLTVKNEGTAPSENTVISDLVPVGLTVNSATAPCTVSSQQVNCVVGTLAPGETKSYEVITTAKILTVDTANDQLTIGKVEQHVSIQAGQTQTAQITCGPDGIMSDGSVRVDSVDQGTGDLNSVEVHKVKSIAESTYEATVTNHSTGQAQTKLFGVCLPKQTTGGHPLLVSAPVTQTVELDTGLHTVNLVCGVGYTPIAPGIDVAGGRSWVIASAPNGPTGRKVTLKVDQDNTNVEVSIRCLSNRTGEVNGASSELQFTPITKSIQVGAGQTVSEQLTCGENAKGIVAGWEYDEGLIQLGNDPQPITRVFKIWNPTWHPLNATLYLLCLEVRTGTPGGNSSYVNTAQVSSSSSQAPGAQLSDDASVTVEPVADTPAPPELAPAPVPAPGATESSDPAPRSAKLSGSSLRVQLSEAGNGRALVVSPNKFRIGKRLYRKASVLGNGASAGKSSITIKLRKPAIKAIKAGKVKRVKVTVTSSNGTAKSKVLRIKRG